MPFALVRFSSCDFVDRRFSAANRTIYEFTRQITNKSARRRSTKSHESARKPISLGVQFRDAGGSQDSTFRGPSMNGQSAIMARPCRCAASLWLAGNGPVSLRRSSTCFCGLRPRTSVDRYRQVVDLPRISMAKPFGAELVVQRTTMEYSRASSAGSDHACFPEVPARGSALAGFGRVQLLHQ